MNVLQQAKTALEQAAKHWQRYDAAGCSPHYRGQAEDAERRTVAFALVAQAEALTRIAECMEQELDDKTQRLEMQADGCTRCIAGRPATCTPMR